MRNDIKFLIACGFSGPAIADILGLGLDELRYLCETHHLRRPKAARKHKSFNDEDVELAEEPRARLVAASRYPVPRAGEKKERHGDVRVLMENGQRVNKVVKI